ncbi:MAG: hypothetical protein Q9180_002143 [Flavoplaca navasiana]
MSRQKKGSVDLAASDIHKLQHPSADTATPGKPSIGAATKPSTPTPTSATRPTKSSASRGTPTASSVKSSARPVVNTTRSRPQSTLLSSESPAITHRPRASVGSVTTSTKGNAGASIESKRGSEKKSLSFDRGSRSTSPIKPPSRSTVKQSTPRSSTPAKRQSVTSKAKAAPVQNSTRNGQPTPTPSAAETTKQVRPGLGTRKSTMSVTIEQRLRDISIVHQMLRVAMADDGDDDDEVKEQYGKEADERLADLRARLEEARTAEAQSSHQEQPDTETSIKEDHAELPEVTLPKSEAEDPDRSSIQRSTEEGDDVISEATRKNPVAEDFDLSGISSSDQGDFTRLQDANASLESRLEYTQVTLQNKESEISRLSEVIATLQAESLEERSDAEHEAHRCQGTIDELRADLEITKQGKASAEHEVQQLRISKQRCLEESHTDKEWFEKQLQGHKDAEARAAKAQSLTVSSLRQELQESHCSRDRETIHLQKAVEALQTRIEEMNEAKQGEIDTLKDSFAAEHEDVVTKLQTERHDAVARSKYQLDEVRSTLGSVHAANAELRQASDETEERHRELISGLEIALKKSQAEAAQLSTEKAEALKQIQRLRDAEGTIGTALRSTEEDLKQKSEQIVSLLERVEASEGEYQSVSERYREVEEELARVNTECHLHEQRAADYLSKLDRFQREESANEQAIEQLAERRLVVRSLQQTVDALRQEVHNKDTQLDTLRAERDVTAQRTDATKSSNASKLEKLADQLRTAQAMNDQKTTRIRELESALKVTTAELVELQTERPSESSDSEVPSRRLSLRLSRWPKTDSSSDGQSSGSYDWAADLCAKWTEPLDRNGRPVPSHSNIDMSRLLLMF